MKLEPRRPMAEVRAEQRRQVTRALRRRLHGALLALIEKRRSDGA